jgi:hypothetical protein
MKVRNLVRDITQRVVEDPQHQSVNTLKVRQDARVPVLPTEDNQAASKKYVDDHSGSLFSTVNNVTESRAFDTVYQNENAFPIDVMVTANCSVLSEGASPQGSSGISCYTGTTNSPNIFVTAAGLNFGIEISVAYGGMEISVSCRFIVPAGYYYVVYQQASGYYGKTPEKIAWIEYGGTGTEVVE